jgi:crotonobetainyl-CoA:carnitine CoA-transferase CaiB-like acyl-CoA transferase
MPTTPQSPLAGLRVLDASRVLAGPFCGQILGDLGADVIKVERPGQGDETRAWGPPFAEPLASAGGQPLASGGREPPVSAYFLSCNRNKRAITLDLGQPKGMELFHDLVRRSDVLLENFRAASAARLRLSPETLLRVNPRLVLCSISGFGRTGPLKDLPGYDFAIQALSGLMSITGPPEGPPCKVGVAVTDVLTGLYAAVAVLASLRAREQSGHGYAIDLALLDCAVAGQVNLAQAYLTSGMIPPRQGNAHFQIVPYQLFATADSWLVLAVGNDGQWQRFCTTAGRPELAADARFSTNTLRVQHRHLLVPLLEDLLRIHTTVEWQTRLQAVDVPHAPVWNYADVFAHPQAQARGLRITVHDPQGRPVDLVGSPFHIDAAGVASGASMASGGREPVPPPPSLPPLLGQHTDHVLSELLGLTPTQLAELRGQRVI